MQAQQANFLEFLQGKRPFVIPIYQRKYSWEKEHCEQLWNDIIQCGENDLIPIHFIGSVVFVESSQYLKTTQTPLLLIDGQQRVTSVTLLLSAVAESIESTEPFDGFTKSKIRNRYLIDPDEIGEKRFKLLLSETDKTTLMDLVEGKEPDKNNFSIRVKENYDFFKKQIESNRSKLASLCKGLTKLMIVEIGLNRGQDNPQLIFESMNSTGKDLSQADLIRNFVLMDLEHDFQTDLYKTFWHPMESGFVQNKFDEFMRHYLTTKTGIIPKIEKVYDEFKKYSHVIRSENEDSQTHIKNLVISLKDYAGYFCAMAFDKETDKELKVAFYDLRELKVDVAYPLLLEFYHDYAIGILPKSDFVTAIRWIESYVFRRAVCSIPTNSMNRTFATFSKGLKKEKDHYLESIAANFLLLPTYRSFPNDANFEHDIKIRDLYHFQKNKYWLRRLENYGRKELVAVEDYTIEHILPQNENLNEDWRNDLGSNWEDIQQNYLHTLGNLTLTGYNASYSDHSFKIKRNLEGTGFKFSPLKMNEGLGGLEVWNEDAIKKRALQLAKKALEVWQIPVLSSTVLDSYRIDSQQVSSELDDTDSDD